MCLWIEIHVVFHKTVSLQNGVCHFQKYKWIYIVTKTNTFENIYICMYISMYVCDDSSSIARVFYQNCLNQLSFCAWSNCHLHAHLLFYRFDNVVTFNFDNYIRMYICTYESVCVCMRTNIKLFDNNWQRVNWRT